LLRGSAPPRPAKRFQRVAACTCQTVHESFFIIPPTSELSVRGPGPRPVPAATKLHHSANGTVALLLQPAVRVIDRSRLAAQLGLANRADDGRWAGESPPHRVSDDPLGSSASTGSPWCRPVGHHAPPFQRPPSASARTRRTKDPGRDQPQIMGASVRILSRILNWTCRRPSVRGRTRARPRRPAACPGPDHGDSARIRIP
jgi:hypothetical protein